MKAHLKQYFGYDTFRPQQEEIIANVLSKQDTFVLMPTGGGKSLCFQLPALMLPGITLVISPLIALMKDQVDSLKENGIAAECIHSNVAASQIFDIQQQAIAGTLKLLYIAPERLAQQSFQSFLQRLTLSLIAIDEAHCISAWGHDFRPDYRNLHLFRNQWPTVPIIALTATATHQVRDDIMKQLSLTTAGTYVSSFDRPNLNLTIRRKRDFMNSLITLLDGYKQESAIIYCFSRKDTEEIATVLCAQGIKAAPYHAGLHEDKRKRNQENFIKDKIDVIVATIAFGMGIDKPDVRLVVHHTFPKNMESYYQEIGRAGRDGLPSQCVLFYSYGDKIKHDYFLNQIHDADLKKNTSKKLQEMIDFAERRVCRRVSILKYFGEEYTKQSCEHCDVCNTEVEMIDATVISQKILSAVLKTGNRFGGNYIIDILRGSKLKKILENKHDQLSVFGIVQKFSKDALKDIIAELITHNILQKTSGKYPLLEVSQAGRTWLKERNNISIKAPRISIVGPTTGGKAADSLPYHEALFQTLRLLRKKLASEHNIPPYMIFGDGSLHEMAYYLPQDDAAFLKITGVGHQKLQQYAYEFLPLIQEFTTENDLPPVAKSGEYKPKPVKTASVLTATLLTTQALIQQETSLDEIAAERSLSLGTVLSHLLKIKDIDPDSINIEYLKPQDESFEAIKEACAACGKNSLGEIYRYLKGEYSYDSIKIALLFVE